MQDARQAAMSEIRPIDDIRSTARYRSAVLGNLVVDFLEQLAQEERQLGTLTRWNNLPAQAAAQAVLDCCGSTRWARQLAAQRPFADESSLIVASDEIWKSLEPSDWNEAFSRHPRIGEQKASASASTQAATWSSQEQQQAANESEEIQSALVHANREYEAHFGRIFIVCATGKSASEMLEILYGRMQNDSATELCVSAEEQRKITNLRLRKWLTP
jgi:2-oxo-4-hydroxy-4-carboxy-5-ureidoimidazoline decarboxylase